MNRNLDNLLFEAVKKQTEEEKEIKRIGHVVIFRNKGNKTQVLIGSPEDHKRSILPGGHLKNSETILEGTLRELQEETGLRPTPESLYYVNTYIRSRDDDKKRIETVFALVIDSNTEVKGKSDLGEIQWIDVDKIDTIDINQQQIINKAKNIIVEDPDKLGELIVVEGIDGAGKTTAVKGVLKFLTEKGIPVVRTKWNSSETISPIIKQLKKEKTISPHMFSLLHMADMFERYEKHIQPALRKNKVVICDRYTYTSMIRDNLRGVSLDTIQSIYKQLRKPDYLFHCTLDPKIALRRLQNDKGFTYYGSGMDIYPGLSKTAACEKYLVEMDKLYRKILPDEKGYIIVNTEKSPKEIIEFIGKKLRDY